MHYLNYNNIKSSRFDQNLIFVSFNDNSSSVCLIAQLGRCTMMHDDYTIT